MMIKKYFISNDKRKGVFTPSESEKTKDQAVVFDLKLKYDVFDRNKSQFIRIIKIDIR